MNDNDRMFVENDLRLTCADAVELVTDYLDSALDAADLERFTGHLAMCEGCQVYLDQIRRTVHLVGTMGSDRIELRPKSFDALARRLGERRSQ